jgi:uncharacterized protein (UPF0216 family)
MKYLTLETMEVQTFAGTIALLKKNGHSIYISKEELEQILETLEEDSMTDKIPVTIDEDNNIHISSQKLSTDSIKVYDKCLSCGLKLYGGERSGEDANGYCDVCN